jgi:hypothetical protein
MDLKGFLAAVELPNGNTNRIQGGLHPIRMLPELLGLWASSASRPSLAQGRTVQSEALEGGRERNNTSTIIGLKSFLHGFSFDYKRLERVSSPLASLASNLIPPQRLCESEKLGEKDSWFYGQ